jgi:hypothetical protein
MFGKKQDERQYSLDVFAKEIEAVMIRSRKEHLNSHGVERVLEQALQVHRSYIAASLRF